MSTTLSKKQNKVIANTHGISFRLLCVQIAIEYITDQGNCSQYSTFVTKYIVITEFTNIMKL